MGEPAGAVSHTQARSSLVSVLLASLQAYVAISQKGNQLVAGIAINPLELMAGGAGPQPAAVFPSEKTP